MKIITPLCAKIVPTGTSILLPVKYEASPYPNIKWLKNGKEIFDNNDVVIINKINETLLKISNISKQDTGKYELILTNDVGIVKTSGSITTSNKEISKISIPPVFIKSLEPKYAYENEVVIFEANVDSNPLSSFQWFFNEKPVDSDEIKIFSENNYSILLIKNFKHDLSGCYTCCAENVDGITTTSASLILTTEIDYSINNTAPIFKEKFNKQSVMDGEKLVIKLNVISKPIPKITWYHNGKEISDTKDITTTQNNAGECVLNITEVFPEDAGEYECKAINKLGEDISKSSIIVEGIFIYDYDHSKNNLTAYIKLEH